VYKHILVATDGSELGQKGLEHGLSLAQDQSARVTIITVSEPYPLYAGDAFGMVPGGAVVAEYGSSQIEATSALLATAAQAATTAGIEAETLHVPNAPPAEAIIEAAKSLDCDLIVMGSHGRRGFGRIVLGSKTWEVVTLSHVPVLVVR
jgi:nucleotide-binding universal stress UspA family protein